MDVAGFIGQNLLDRDGLALGRISEILVDETSGRPKWAVIDGPELPGGSKFVPLGAAGQEEGVVRAGVGQEQVRTAPAVEVVAGRLSPEQEALLLRHYEITDAEAQLGGSAGDAEPAREPVPIDEVPAMIRSEEELVVEKHRMPHERVRFVKRVVTETVTQVIEVRREELHIERVVVQREPGTVDSVSVPEPASTITTSAEDSVSSVPKRDLAERLPDRLRGGLLALQRRATGTGGALSDQREPFTDETVEVDLLQEEVVVSKRVVPRERVRIRRQTVVEPKTISSELRKERVGVETSGTPATGDRTTEGR